jgi:serine phosphatase RsbU (regulator of sigma subunit)
MRKAEPKHEMTNADVAAPNRPGEILVVEDDAGDALLVEELLYVADLGLSTTRASSLSEATGQLTPATACILLDLGLPDAAGLDGLRHLVAAAPRVPVIVLTGLADRVLGEAAVSAGAQDYLAKGSVDGEGLARAVRYAIERQRGQEAARQLVQAVLLRAENARLERGLLPRPRIFSRSFRWVTRYQPGGGRALLGGDFLDGVELPDGTLRIILGDVAGHGPDEAALGIALRVAWRALVFAGVPPADIFDHLEGLLDAERRSDADFVTAVDLVVLPDLSAVELRTAGHPSPLLVRDGSVREVALPSRGPLLGVIPDATWGVDTVILEDDWLLAVFSDGLIEGRSSEHGRLGTAGLQALLADAVARHDDLGSIADHLIAGAEAANGGLLVDDVALFLLTAGA